MITVDYGHCKISYDETIEVGDLITAYHKGFHRVTKVTPRKNSTPHFEYIQVAKADGTKTKAKERACDASYCVKLTVVELQKMYAKEVQAVHEKFDLLMEYAQTTSK